MEKLNFGKGLLFILCMLSSVSASAEPKKQLWLYTSIFKEFIAPIKTAFELEHPEIELQVFQAGSEKIQAKIEAELVAQ